MKLDDVIAVMLGALVLLVIFVNMPQTGQVVSAPQRGMVYVSGNGSVEPSNDYCLEADGYIRGAKYQSGVLTLTILNNGKIPLTFNTTLTYKNGTVDYSEPVNTTAGNITTVKINASANLEKVTIESEECPVYAWDYISYYHIVGMR